jgi:hypothetical protein
VVSEARVLSRFCAFGLAVTSEVDILGTHPEPELTLPGVRLRMSRSGKHESSAAGEVVLERRWADDSLGMRVRRLPDDGYAIDAPGYGNFRVTPGGETAWLSDLRGPPARWQRPLLGQVLPLLSTLNGYETLHASAAVIDGGAVAISAPSNTGKTSLMINLVDRGARLLADDVVALRSRGAELLAHPGSPLMNLSADQHALLSAATQERLGHPLGESDKLTFAVTGLRGDAAPLRAFFTLTRSARRTKLRLVRVHAPSPTELLAATFLPHVMTPERLRVQFEVCEKIASAVPVFRLDAPASVRAVDLAQVVEEAVRGSGVGGNAWAAAAEPASDPS